MIGSSFPGRAHRGLARPLLVALAASAGCDAGSPAAPTVGPGPGDASAGADILAPTGDAGADAALLPRGERTFGIGTDARSTTYAADARTVLDAGGRYTTIAFAWDEIESPFDAGAPDAGPASYVYEPTLHVSALVLPAIGARAILSVDAVDTSGPRLPVDLGGRALDDPEVIARFSKAQEYALAQTAALDLAGYLVGSGIDVGLGTDASALAAFATFFGRVAADARAKRPGLKVGFSVSADALAAHAADLAPAWAQADLAAVTMSPPLGSVELPLRPPEPLAAEIDRAGGAAPAGKPLWILDAAYPSGAVAGSDPSSQAAFVRAVFAAWDRQASRIPVLVFTRLDEMSLARASTTAARLGRTDPAFLDALRTLGLRDDAARPKPAFEALVYEARARGF